LTYPEMLQKQWQTTDDDTKTDASSHPSPPENKANEENSRFVPHKEAEELQPVHEHVAEKNAKERYRVRSGGHVPRDVRGKTVLEGDSVPVGAF